MNNRIKYSLLFGFFMAFIFTTMSVVNGEFDTPKEIKESLIAILLAGIVSSVLSYFFVKESFINKFFGKNNS